MARAPRRYVCDTIRVAHAYHTTICARLRNAAPDEDADEDDEVAAIALPSAYAWILMQAELNWVVLVAHPARTTRPRR